MTNTVIGIKYLKFWSKLKEIEIQYRLVTKQPKPNNQPYKKLSLKFLCWLDFFTKNKKNRVNVIKLTKKKLYGGKLNEVTIPKMIKNIKSIYNFFFNLVYL